MWWTWWVLVKWYEVNLYSWWDCFENSWKRLLRREIYKNNSIIDIILHLGWPFWRLRICLRTSLARTSTSSTCTTWLTCIAWAVTILYPIAILRIFRLCIPLWPGTALEDKHTRSYSTSQFSCLSKERSHQQKTLFIHCLLCRK